MMNDLGRLQVAKEVDAVQFTTVLIGKQIKQMRMNIGLSQAEVARRAKIRPEMISRLENGRGNPTVRLVERIVKAIERFSS